MDDHAPPIGAADGNDRKSIKPEFCPECGYNLSGLPDEGACPECGAAYGHEIVFFGWGAGSYATMINRKPYPLFWLTFVLPTLPALVIMLLWWPLGLLLAMAYTPLVMGLYLRFKALARAPAPVQLRLSSQGYSVRLGCGPPKWQMWEWVFAVRLIEREPGRHFISIHRMSDAAPVSERARTIELEIQGSVEAMRNIARLRDGALSYVPCMIRSLPPS